MSYPAVGPLVTGYSTPSKKKLRPSDHNDAGGRFTDGLRSDVDQPAGGCGPAPGGGGSRGRVRLVAIKTPIPMRTMMPTAIQEVGTFRRYAPNASPTIRMRKPMRYVANE